MYDRVSGYGCEEWMALLYALGRISKLGISMCLLDIFKEGFLSL